MNKKSIGIWILLFMICCPVCFSQTYQLKSVFEDKRTETYLSHWKKLNDMNDSIPDIFSLWGYQRYDESWLIAYEVEYFKGSLEEVDQFLKEINRFAEKYEKQDKIVTFISGVKIKTIKRYVAVFDKEEKVVCLFSKKGWRNIYDAFVDYCASLSI